MEEKKIKKKKLTLTVSSKKPYNISNYSLGRQKTSVVIEKKFQEIKTIEDFITVVIILINQLLVFKIKQNPNHILIFVKIAQLRIKILK